MSQVKDPLYDLVVFVKHVDADKFEKFLHDNNLFDYGVSESAFGYYFELNRLTDDMCSYILFTSDYTKFIKMQAMMDI